MSIKSVYRKIAREHGVTVAEVKKDMQAAIDYAYKKSDKSASEKISQISISSKNEIPTTDEFIKHIVQTINKP